MDKLQITIITILAAALIAPTAAAGHFTLVRADRDNADGQIGFMDSVSKWNDGGNDVMPVGAPGEGLGERITIGPAGSGNIVLDSRYVSATPNSNFDINHFTQSVTGSPRIFPGVAGYMAWYGWWTDKDGDNVIDEYQASPSNARDEFIWHGAASGNPGLSMVSYVHPSNPQIGCRPPAAPVNTCDDSFEADQPPRSGLRTLGGLENPARKGPDFTFSDRTDGAAPGDEAWIGGNGWFTTVIDESLLMTVHVMTIANAKPALGSPEKFVLNPANPRDDQLRDIDRFESLNADIEALYTSTTPAARAAYGVAASSLVGPLNQLLSSITAGDEQVGMVDDLIFPGYAFDGQTCTGCDFKVAWAPYLDLQVEMVVPTSNVVLPDGTNVGPWGWASLGASALTPSGADRGAEPSYIIGNAHAGWFFDMNGDGWIGMGCPNEDATRAPGADCANPYDHGVKDDPNNYGSTQDHDSTIANAEYLPNCGAVSSSTFWFQPVSGDWPPGTILARQFNHIGGPLASGETAYEAVLGSSAVGLRPDTGACSGGESNAYSKDALILATGTLAVPLRAWVTGNFPAFVDTSIGIDVSASAITDVDFIISPIL